MFRFLDYHLSESHLATFRYQGTDDIIFTEQIQFATPIADASTASDTSNTSNTSDTPDISDTSTVSNTSTASDISTILDQALFLAFVLIGTSYYKSHPSPEVDLPFPLDSWQANFFNQVYQEGLSQYAFENHLSRKDLAHFHSTPNYPSNSTSAHSIHSPRSLHHIPNPSHPTSHHHISSSSPTSYPYRGILSLQSGGKDSLLTATLLSEHAHPFTAFYLSASSTHPTILDQLPAPLQIATRTLDIDNLKKSAGNNGHVPITYIVQSLALIQAILNHQNVVLTSIGQEGNEPHAHIADLPVNHQWSKTWQAEQLFANYVHRYISRNIEVGSPLRAFTELEIAHQFAQKCWHLYGHTFSSCNEANYRQQNDNSRLTWCGRCPKCANSFLLFAPFVDPSQLLPLFGGSDLFKVPMLVDTFKGLLGIDNFMKPFECVGEIAELRQAYALKLPGYADLPFSVPSSDFNYQSLRPAQPFIKNLYKPANPKEV